MTMFTNKAVLLAALEASYSVDPGSGYIGILCNKGLDVKPTGDKVTRDVIRQTYSPAGHVIGIKQTTINPEVELKGGGLDGSQAIQDPELDPLLQCCALVKSSALVIQGSSVSGSFVIGETITNTTASNSVGTLADIVSVTADTAILYIRDAIAAPADADALSGDTSGATANTSGTPEDALCYRPTSTRANMASTTLHFHRDGHRHVLTGCRGTVEFDFTVGKYPVAKFDITGIYNEPTDMAIPSPTFSDVIPSVCLDAGLQIADIDMTKTAVNALTLKLGNDIKQRKDMNAVSGLVGLEITGRNPSGSIDPEAIDLASFNPFTEWKDAGAQKIYCDISGGVAGSKVRVCVPRGVYDSVAYADRDGIVAYQLPFICKGGDEGDDEVWLFFH